MPRRCSILLLLLLASSASAVTMAWTPIGDPGNACDTQSQGCFGAVGYSYNIGTYEVTNAQYAEFLNAKAKSDSLFLYHPNMGDPSQMSVGGISRSGSDGSYTYSAIAGRGNMPVNWVGWYSAVRFANWMNNGQGSGDTETGAYTLLGNTEIPSNGGTVTRNAGATIVLTSEDEWYKAAYYDASSGAYFDYPTGLYADCNPPTAAADSANCDYAVGDLTNVGSYPGSPSPYGTFDQGGNLWEWNEAIISGSYRVVRGGSFGGLPDYLASATRFPHSPSGGDFDVGGFRLAMIPEPGTCLLVIAGMLGLAGWRRARD